MFLVEENGVEKLEKSKKPETRYIIFFAES